MAAERVDVRGIAWRDVCPWLILFRTFGLAIALPVLFLATLGAMLTPVGWRLSESLLVSRHALETDRDWALAVQANRRWPHRPLPQIVPNEGRFPSSVGEVLRTQPDIVQPIFRRFVHPMTRLFDARLRLAEAGYYALGLLWTLLVWGFFGGAITRIAVMKLGREEQIGLGEALAYARRKLGSYLASPLFPLSGVVVLAAPIGLLGWLMRYDWGLLLAGLLWPAVLLAALAITVLLLGLLFGWPLMWGVVSSERQGDAFEAFARSYAYTFQRPLHYLFYAVIATIFGAVGWLLVYQVSEAVIDFARWPAALAAGAERWAVVEHALDDPHAVSGLAAYGAALIGLFEAFVRTIAAAFGYSFFWCLAAAVYLLLRRDTDEAEFDEVAVDQENLRYELPALTPLGAARPGEAPGGAPAPAGPEAEDADRPE